MSTGSAFTQMLIIFFDKAGIRSIFAFYLHFANPAVKFQFVGEVIVLEE